MKVTARDTTKTKTPLSSKTRKKRQQTPDPKQRKIGDLLTFWQGATRPQNKPDSTDTEEAETRTRHQAKTVIPVLPVLPVVNNLTVEKKTVAPDQTTRPDLKSLTVVTVKRGPERVIQSDSPTMTRIREIRH